MALSPGPSPQIYPTLSVLWAAAELPFTAAGAPPANVPCRHPHQLSICNLSTQRLGLQHDPARRLGQTRFESDAVEIHSAVC